MKVLLLNGSPHTNGTTAAALDEMRGVFEKEGVEAELLQIGTEPLRGCIGCRKCLKLSGRCTFDGDIVNEILGKIAEADAFVIGSPVYYASANGAVLSVLDRVFYAGGGLFAGKVGAAVACARRAGTTATLDDLQKYFPINGMPMAATQYWPMVYGMKPGDAAGDLEGLQTVRLLARNIVWMIRSFDAARKAGIEPPAPEEPRAWTHFIR
ncbi:MAG: flavodoxin family protein [Clostridiales Family XIII bacterium]|jgi:multimeric flavodoxin WrbA|nr:flavodoxin family protein [Clostridiales Family XIII bacterium]